MKVSFPTKLSSYKKELVAELNVARTSKLGEAVANVQSDREETEDVHSLKLKIKDLEAEKWTLKNEIKTLQDSVNALSQLTHEGHNHEARSHTLRAEMDAKHSEIVKLIARIEDLEKQDSQVFFMDQTHPSSHSKSELDWLKS